MAGRVSLGNFFQEVNFEKLGQKDWWRWDEFPKLSIFPWNKKTRGFGRKMISNLTKNYWNPCTWT